MEIRKEDIERYYGTNIVNPYDTGGEMLPMVLFYNPGDKPDIHDLSEGQLAYNKADGILYTRGNQNDIIEVWNRDVERTQPIDPLTFLWYADDADSTPQRPDGNNSRVVGFDINRMVVAKEIQVTPYSRCGSCDVIPGRTKMYVRSATTHYPTRYLEVVDVASGKEIHRIGLKYKPRSSGGYNRYRGISAITTKEKPWIYLIDTWSDTVIFEEGDDDPAYDTPQGNDGGNATGHAVWLDANHFALLDRHNVNIQVFKIDGWHPPYTVTKTDTIDLPAAMHSLRSFHGGLELKDVEFYGAVEGISGGQIPDANPAIRKYVFDAGTGALNYNSQYVFSYSNGSIGPTDSIHHFGVTWVNGRRVMGVPLTTSSRVHFIDMSLMQRCDGTNGTSDLVPAEGFYRLPDDSGPGHCDFCTTGGLFAVITNHTGVNVSIIDLNTKEVTNVPIPSLDGLENGVGFTMSHANHVIGEYYYFCDAWYDPDDARCGYFYEVHVPTKTITRSVIINGSCVQSFS